MLDALCGLISIPSVKGDAAPGMPYGRECYNALTYVMNLAARLGLEAENMEGHLCCVSYGEGEETLAILTHIDVVPAGDGWDTHPFTPTLKDGKIIGRGTVDDKGGAIASLYALYAIKELGIKTNKRIKLFFGCDEESGWGDIDYYKAHYPDPEYMITPDAGFPMINREKGLLHTNITKSCGDSLIKYLHAGSRPNIVPNKAECLVMADKAVVDAAIPESKASFITEAADGGTLIKTEGKASHGSHPEGGINALTAMIELLTKLPLKDGAIDTMVKALHTLIGSGWYGEEMGIAATDDLVGALTVNLGAMNAEGEEAEAKIDMRTPIATDLDGLYALLCEKFGAYGITVTEGHKQPSHYVPEDSFIVTQLKKAYEACFGEKCECLPCAGATYARAFGSGIAFGPCDINAERGEHGPNEFIMIDELTKLADVLAAAMTAVACE